MSSNAFTSGTKRPRGRPPGSKNKKKPPATWQDRLVLSPGDELRKTYGEMQGSLLQNEEQHYDVIDAQGQVVGTVEYGESTQIRPPHRTKVWLVQKDLAGNVVVKESW